MSLDTYASASFNLANELRESLTEREVIGIHNALKGLIKICSNPSKSYTNYLLRFYRMISWGNMRDIAKECYENCEIGAVSVIRPDLERGETFEDFQSAVKAAEVMQLNGQIFISDIHKESQTGHRYVDSIMFKRLK